MMMATKMLALWVLWRCRAVANSRFSC